MASVEHRIHADGETWRVVWRQDVHGVRRKQQLGFPEAEQAIRFCKLVEGSGNRWPPGWEPPTLGPDAPMTFGEWADIAITSRARANERTKADYRRDLDRHMEMLVDVPLTSIDSHLVARWVASLEASKPDGHRRPLSAKTLRNLHGFASSIMADALTQHPPLVTHNPFAKRLGKAATVRVEEMVFLTAQEFAMVLRHVREEYRPLIRFLYGTGMRYGEASALRVGDVDLLGQRKTVTITRAWKRTGPATWVVGEPKTVNSRRTISLSPELVEMLIPLVSARESDELLFCGPHGLRLPHIEVWKRGWAPAVARAGVCDTHWQPQRTQRSSTERPRLPKPCKCAGVLTKKPRIHDLRHSHVSALIAAGVQLPAISRRLGHSSITITWDRYGHLDPSMDAAIDAAVDKSLMGSLPARGVPSEA